MKAKILNVELENCNHNNWQIFFKFDIYNIPSCNSFDKFLAKWIH